ncbi:hypothetical protein NKDENANG_02035 [Candidatus Entotheonellaceae bacterium PAL068K]
MQCYKEAAVTSQAKDDWYDVAAIALMDSSEELTCYGLKQFFGHAKAADNLNAWYIYIGLFHKFSNYSALITYLETPGRTFSQPEENILLETGIYLLQIANKDQAAPEFIQRWLTGQSPKDLALEALKQFDDRPSETYQQVASSLSATRETNKKPQPQTLLHQPQGYVREYFPSRNYGFLRGMDGTKYFFHRSAVVDEELFDKISSLQPQVQISVVFKRHKDQKDLLLSEYRCIAQSTRCLPSLTSLLTMENTRKLLHKFGESCFCTQNTRKLKGITKNGANLPVQRVCHEARLPLLVQSAHN